MDNGILADVLIIFVVAIPVVILFHRLRLTSMAGFLVTGAIIGPSGLGLIGESEQIERLAEVGVTLILFSAGLEFSFRNLMLLRRFGLFGGLLQITGMIAAGLVLGLLLGWTPYRGIYLGCILALSSTAVVLSLLYQRRLIDTLQGQIITAMLILQDLAVIPMMVLLPAFATPGSGVDQFLLVGWKMLQAALIIGCVALIIRYCAEPFFHRVARARSRELFLITVITLALGMAWLTSLIGLSTALGGFLGGLIVGGTRYQFQAMAEISPFRYCFNSLFFTSIGMLIDFDMMAQHWDIVLVLLMAIPTLKATVTAGALRILGLPLRLATTIGISLGQIGEFSFLLAYIGVKLEVILPEFYQIVITTAALSMVVTPVMMHNGHRLAHWISRLPIIRHWSYSHDELRIDSSASNMHDHVIICGFGPTGEQLGTILEHHHIEYFVIELNPDTVQRLMGEGRQVFYGDGASEEILYKCGLERARLLAITTPDFLNAAAIIQQARSMSADIQIVTRARYRRQVDELYMAGANMVIVEEDEVGEALAKETFRVLKIPDSLRTT